MIEDKIEDKNLSKKINYWKLIKKGILVLFSLFILLAIFSLLPIPGNYKIYTVQSGSMSPEIKSGYAVIVKPTNQYFTSDIITFNNTDNQKETITHRIIDTRQDNNETVYITKGDANDGADSKPVYDNNIVGKVIFSIPLIGYPINFTRTLAGLIILIVVPTTIIIYEEIKKIKNEWKKVKRRKIQKENDNPEAPNGSTQLSKKEKIWMALKKHRKLIILALIVSSGLALSQSAFAITKTSGDLTIIYPNDPLFNETNIAPGYLTSKIITITNSSAEEKNIGVEFFGTADTELNDVLVFFIQKNGTTIYGGSSDPKTLADLITAGEINLTTLASTTSADFTITSELGVNVDNSYQGKISVFDLSVGFIEIESLPLSIPPVDIPPNTNGLILGEEIVNKEPPLQGNILGIDIELPITGRQLLNYSLLLIPVAIISIFVVVKVFQRYNSIFKK